jgi:hypothetical protein
MSVSDEELSLIRARISYDFNIKDFNILQVYKSKEFIDFETFLTTAKRLKAELVMFYYKGYYYYAIIRETKH